MPFYFGDVRESFDSGFIQVYRSLANEYGTGQTHGSILRLALLFSCALALALAVGACANADEGGEPAIQETLKVKNLEIVDDGGNTRAVFTTISGGRPSLTLLDSNGDFRVWLTLNDDGSPNLLLIDQGRIVLMDGIGGIRSTYSLDEADNPSIRYFSQAGDVRSSSGLDEDGDPLAELFDESGQVVWSAP